MEILLQEGALPAAQPIERFFSKLRRFRRIATCYDKLAENFLGMVKLASMRLWPRAYQSTTQLKAALSY